MTTTNGTNGAIPTCRFGHGGRAIKGEKGFGDPGCSADADAPPGRPSEDMFRGRPFDEGSGAFPQVDEPAVRPPGTAESAVHHPAIGGRKSSGYEASLIFDAVATVGTWLILGSINLAATTVGRRWRARLSLPLSSPWLPCRCLGCTDQGSVRAAARS